MSDPNVSVLVAAAPGVSVSAGVSTVTKVTVVDDTVAVVVAATQIPATVVNEVVEVVVSTGPAGPTGPTGPPASDVLYPASLNMSGNRAVIYSPGIGWVYADRTIPSHGAAAIGITTGAISSGAIGPARFEGIMDEPSWAWPAPCALYLDTTGFMTATPPVAGFVREVAAAVSPTRIFISPQLAIKLA